MTHFRKTPESLNGEKCAVCCATGGLRKAKLVLDWEWSKNHAPNAASDPKNRAILCRLCEDTYRAVLGQAPLSGDLLAVSIHRKEALLTLTHRRKDLLQSLPKDNLFGSTFGKVETRKDYKKRLERAKDPWRTNGTTPNSGGSWKPIP